VNDGNEEDVFTNAPSFPVTDRGNGKGDKSKGWGTQKQRPGQWKKPTQRR